MVHEVYDYPGNRAMISRYHSNLTGDLDSGMAKTLYLYDHNEYIIQNSSGCFGFRAGAGERDMFYDNNTHRLKGTHEFFQFAADGTTEQYIGRTDINGELVDQWRAVVGIPDSRPGGGLAGSMILNYYFTAPGWLLPDSNWSGALPVLLDLEGWMMRGPMYNHTFRHQYVFSAIRVGPVRRPEIFELDIGSDESCSGDIGYIPRHRNAGQPGAGCPTPTTMPGSRSSAGKPYTTSQTVASSPAADQSCSGGDGGMRPVAVIGIVIVALLVGAVVGVAAINGCTGKRGQAVVTAPGFGDNPLYDGQT